MVVAVDRAVQRWGARNGLAGADAGQGACVRFFVHHARSCGCLTLCPGSGRGLTLDLRVRMHGYGHLATGGSWLGAKASGKAAVTLVFCTEGTVGRFYGSYLPEISKLDALWATK